MTSFCHIIGIVDIVVSAIFVLFSFLMCAYWNGILFNTLTLSILKS